MGGKLDWRRTRTGHGGFDERAGKQWTRGVDDVDIETDGDSIYLPPDLLAPPDALFPTRLKRVVAERTDEGIDRLKNLAAKAAAEIYRRHGADTLVSRVEAYYDRVLLTPWHFPSAWYAVYFDVAARRIAAGRKLHDPPPRRRLDRFFGVHEAWARMLRVRELVAYEGGPKAVWELGRRQPMAATSAESDEPQAATVPKAP